MFIHWLFGYIIILQGLLFFFSFLYLAIAYVMDFCISQFVLIMVPRLDTQDKKHTSRINVIIKDYELCFFCHFVPANWHMILSSLYSRILKFFFFMCVRVCVRFYWFQHCIINSVEKIWHKCFGIRSLILIEFNLFRRKRAKWIK